MDMDIDFANYEVYIFKPSGKWYTTEFISFDTSLIPCYEVRNEAMNKFIGQYNGMHKVLIPYETNPELYMIPVMFE